MNNLSEKVIEEEMIETFKTTNEVLRNKYDELTAINDDKIFIKKLKEILGDYYPSTKEENIINK